MNVTCFHVMMLASSESTFAKQDADQEEYKTRRMKRRTRRIGRKSSSPAQVLTEKFETSVSVLNSAVKPHMRPSRYHKYSKCIYFSSTPEGAFAEAAHYFHLQFGHLGYGFSPNFFLLNVEIQSEKAVPTIETSYPISSLTCDLHPLREPVEQLASESGNHVLSAPSARHPKSRKIAVYDVAAISSVSSKGPYSLSIDPSHPVYSFSGPSSQDASIIVGAKRYE